jgi:flagellar biosynthesis protein FlhG
MAKVITITSGKGGVGKTNSSINIGIALASKGFKVCLFDADTGLANVNVLLGLKPEATLEQVLSGEKNLEEIMLEAQRGLKIIPAASGIAECADLDPKKRKRLIDSLRQLEEQFDYILIDTAAGIGESVLDFVTSADYPIVVITPEPTSLTDAFSMVKMLKNRDYAKPLYALINMAKDYDNSIEVFNRFQAAVDKYLKTEVFYLGYVALDENVISSVSFQFPAIIMQADAPASLCFQKLADVMEKQFIETDEPHNFSQFWENIPAINKESLTETVIQPAGTESVLPTETLADSALRLLSEHETKQESAKAFLDPLIKTYIDRFQSFPIAPYQALYQQLEMSDFPESDIRELVNTLESLFEKHYKKPLRNLDSTVIKLLADANGSEEKLVGLNRLLKNSFKRQYNQRLNVPLEEMTEWISDREFTEGDYSNAQRAQEKAFESRFNKPYKNEKDILIEQLRAQISELTNQKEKAGELFTELSKAMNDTEELRNNLSLVLNKEELIQEDKKNPA